MRKVSEDSIEEGEVTEVEDGWTNEVGNTAEDRSVEGPKATVELVACQRAPRCSWLHEELTRYSVYPDLIQQCEDLLIVQEGFTTREVFASIPTSKMTHDYLMRIGVRQLGVQGILLTMHKTLREEIAHAELANIPPPAVRWLRAKLNATHTLPHLQRECEWKLVVQEGITSKDLFASLPENVFNVGYLKRIGIDALGLQHLLLEFHSELHYAYIQHLNFMARSHSVVPQKMGHKRNAERGYERDNYNLGGNGSDGAGEGSSSSNRQQQTHKKARHEDVEIDIEVD